MDDIGKGCPSCGSKPQHNGHAGTPRDSRGAWGSGEWIHLWDITVFVDDSERIAAFLRGPDGETRGY